MAAALQGVRRHRPGACGAGPERRPGSRARERMVPRPARVGRGPRLLRVGAGRPGPAGDRVLGRPPPGGRHRRDLAGRAIGRSRERPLRRRDDRRPPARRRPAPAGLRGRGLGRGARRRRVRPLDPHSLCRAGRRPARGGPPRPDMELAVGEDPRRLRAEPRRVASLHRARRTGLDDHDPARGGARERRAGRPAPAEREGDGPVHPRRRRGLLRAHASPSTASATPRSRGGRGS